MQQDNSIQPPSQPLNPGPSLPDEPEDQILVGGAEDPKKEGWKSTISTILILVAAPLVALFLITFVFQSYEVDGPSMETTLQNQDRLIIDKLPRSIARLTGNPYIPHRGDIIVFNQSGAGEFEGAEKRQLIKRVIGLPGERVVLKDGVFTVYNKERPNGFNPDLDPSYSAAIKSTPGSVDVVVGENEIFVSGDNRNNSLDSRYFGPIPLDDVVGKLSFRIFPINKAGPF